MTTNARQFERDQTVLRVIGPSADPAIQRQALIAVTTYPTAGEPAPGHTAASSLLALRTRDLAPSMAAPSALLATKLYMPPPRRNLVRRPHLTERLSNGLRGPLTILVAPAGSGKTTVFAEWYAAQQESANGTSWPVAWLSLDAGDNDLARFLRYVVAALQTLRAGLGGFVLASLRSPQPPPVEALLTLLVNDLAALSDDVILVLDDYHVIEAPRVHHALIFLLEHLPPRVHLVIATRAEPPLPLARLRARDQMIELRADDLRFSGDEAAAFLTGTMGLHLSAQDAAMIETCTEGWIGGLQLAALALRGREPGDLIAAYKGAHRYVLDFLADEVFDHQAADVRRFLLHTSVLDRLSGPLCDAVTAGTEYAAARGDGQAMLERLEAANLFLVPLDDTRTWYRYHHLFAHFLRERLRREKPALASDLHRRAGRWYEQQGLLAGAADHALAAADYAQAARLMERVITPMLWQHGELATLRHWLDQLPREVARTRPRLCLDLAWTLLWSTQVDAVETRLQDAEHALDTPDVATPPPAGSAEPHPPTSTQVLRGEIAAIRAQLARQQGEPAAAVALARQALADLPTDDRRVRGVTAGLLGSAYLSIGNAAAASQAFGEAVALSRGANTAILALITSGRLVLAQALHGQLHQAAETYRQTLELAASYGIAASALGVAQVGMGEVLREWNDLDGAEDLLRQGIAHCALAGGRTEMAVDGALALARVLQARGNFAGALAALDKAEALGRDGRVAQYAERVAGARARLWLTATPGDVAAAMRWATGRDGTWRPDEPLDHVGLLDRLALARLRLRQGRHDEASALLQRLLSRAEGGGLTGSVIEILALHARLCMEQDQPARAMIALTRALALAEPEGYVRVFVDEGAPMVTLLRQARARGVAPAYVAALLCACAAAETAANGVAAVGLIGGVSAAPLVEPLSARELELLRLLAAGLSTPEIATQLFITTGTARNHLKSIYGKLDVHSRLQAVERARALNLL